MNIALRKKNIIKINTMQKKIDRERENQTELPIRRLLNNMLIGQTIKAQPSIILLLVISVPVKTISFFSNIPL